MGLKKTVNFKGVDIIDAYIKVKHFSGNKDNICFNIQVYANKDISDSNDGDYLYISKSFYFVPNINGNLWIQAYNYLKTLEEFLNAEDV